MRRLFDNPVFGYHAELALGWSEDQLVTTAKHLSAFLPGGLTRRMRMAIAAFAMSVVHAEQVFGLGVHYPRGKEAYRVPARYRYAGPYCTWHYITHSADCLHDAGFIKQSLGVWGQNGNGYESAAFSVPALTALIGPLITDLEVGGLTGPTESVVRRDARKKLMDYEDTAETCRMREELTTINESLARLEIRRNGARVPVPPVRRIFNESFERGGRLYCHGASHQNMPKEDRPDLEFVIDSVAHKVVEVDYSVLHVAMAYAKAGVDLPAGGPYEIEGYDRDVVKMAVNTIFNAGTRRSAIDAVTNKLAGGAARPGVRPWFSPVRPDAARLVEAVARKHDAINHLFGSDCGSRFQRTDSDMAVEVMHRMIARTGHCPLPVHDSFIVAETDAQALIETMTEVAHEHGINPPLKVSRQDSIMRVTNDLEPKTGVQAKREPEDGCGPDIQPTAPKGCGGQHRTPGHGHCHSLGGNNPHAAGRHISLGPRGLSGAHVEKRNLATGADSIGTWFRHARRRYGERAPPGVSRLAATVAGQTQR